MPCQTPPWGVLTAVNVNTGDIAWQVRWASPTGCRKASRTPAGPAMAGPIVTAGGVTFIGGTDDQRFRAFDSKTGKELWTTKLDYTAHATPITYQGKDGRQYVGVVATGGSYLGSPTGRRQPDRVGAAEVATYANDKARRSIGAMDARP